MTPPTSRRRKLIVAVGIAAAAVAAVGWFVAYPAWLFDRADSALLANDPHAATALIDRYLTRKTGDPVALLLAARAARRADACADAERRLTELEGLAGETPAVRHEWALLGVQQGDFGDREAGLRADAAGNHPDAAAILEALAKGYVAVVRYPDAGEALDRLLRISPNHAPGLVLRSTLTAKLRKLDAAEADARKAVAVAPASAAAHAALAAILARRGHTREAIRHFEIVLRHSPGDPAALRGLARALEDAADPAAAEARLDELLARHPDHPDGLTDRARIALRRGQAAVAEPLLARATKLAPRHREAARLHADALKELGRPGDANRVAELTADDGHGGALTVRARDNPMDTAVRWELVRWCHRNGDDAEVVAWLAEILRASPQHPQARAAFAHHFERIGQPRRAAKLRAASTGGQP